MRIRKLLLPTALAFTLAGSVIDTNAIFPTDIAADGLFHLVDFESGEILEGSYGAFRDAKAAYHLAKEDYVNLGIVKDGVTYEAEYALAQFQVDDACAFEITYTNTSDGTEGNLNGCYGVDAAYLYTDDEGQYATFSLSGVTAQTALENVTVVPLQNVYVNLSMFTVRDGILYHMIKGEMEDDYYGYIVSHGTAPEYLEEDHAYYSYDGHFFYSDDSLYQMLDDYRNGIRDNSVNPDNPWYDWYQFVSHRTITNASLQAVKDYFSETMGITGPIDRFNDTDKDGNHDVLNESQLYGMEDSFFQFQYEFGSNALMMLAISQMESSNGRSSLSFTRNNLFSHAAYENEEEASLGRYRDLRNSIYSHAKYYMSGSYLSPMKEQYNGGFFGNKSAGMNVRYSADPYWGEKAAAAYRTLDEALGIVDENKFQIGIRTVEDETIVYKDASTETPLYTTGEMPDMAFVIIGEESNDSGDWYKIQSDATLDENHAVDLSYYYSWSQDYAYIKQDSVQLIIGERPEETSYVSVGFEGDGGVFAGNESSVRYDLPSARDAAITVPAKENAEFSGFDMDLSALDADIDFTAQYKAVSDVVLSNMPKTEYELNDRIDLSGGTVRIIYEDGSDREIPITTSMISGFDMNTDGDQTADVHYGGFTTSYTINVSAEKDEARAAIKNRILDVISSYGEREELQSYEIDNILEVKRDMDQSIQPYLTMPEFRSFDTILRKAYQDKIRYVVNDDSYGLGISGLSISIPLEEGQLEKRETEQDTYRISIHDGISKDAKEALNKEAEYLGETVLKEFTIDLSLNMDNMDTDATLLYTISRPSDSEGGDVYTVLTYTPEGEIIQCYTRQTTNTISFMNEGTGEFVLLSRNTSNQYVGSDPVETLTETTSNTDIRAIIAQIAVAAIILVVIVFGSMYILGKRRRRTHTAIHQERRKQYEKDSKNLEVTQALEILNTEMLRLDDIRKADDEQYGKKDSSDNKLLQNTQTALKKFEETFRLGEDSDQDKPIRTLLKPVDETMTEEGTSAKERLSETASKMGKKLTGANEKAKETLIKLKKKIKKRKKRPALKIKKKKNKPPVSKPDTAVTETDSPQPLPKEEPVRVDTVSDNSQAALDMLAKIYHTGSIEAQKEEPTDDQHDSDAG